jgi:hypothetical protein
VEEDTSQVLFYFPKGFAMRLDAQALWCCFDSTGNMQPICHGNEEIRKHRLHPLLVMVSFHLCGDSEKSRVAGAFCYRGSGKNTFSYHPFHFLAYHYGCSLPAAYQKTWVVLKLINLAHGLSKRKKKKANQFCHNSGVSFEPWAGLLWPL